MKLVLKTKKCPHCKEIIKRTYLHFKYFDPKMYHVDKKTERVIWRNKCCWKCKKKPLAGEVWGGTISDKERNRLFCPECSEWINNKIKQNEK